MSLIYILIGLSLLLWLFFFLYNYYRRPYIGSDLLINPKVNLGRAAGVHSIQGQRSHMEDSYFGDHTKSFFAVYDGHGGSKCAQYASLHLHELILKHNVQEGPINALTEGYKELDRLWLELAAHHNWDDGSTAISCLIVNKTLFVANVGDSRAVLCSNGKAIEMSSDHKPNRPDERERIEKLGGRIIHYGTWRVEGVLAVTRAIGDRRLKKYVSAVPDIRTKELSEGDDYLILATDGVWDVLSSQTACDIVSSTKVLGNVQQSAMMLTNAAYTNQSLDNITSLVIDLRPFR
jgi:protein phosphatase 1L